MNGISLADLQDLRNAGSLPWIRLRMLRSKYKDNQQMQELLAPLEHRAYAREAVKDSPIMGTLGMGTAIPLYQLKKMFGMQKGTTPASLDELFAGYQGIAQGLR